MWWKLKAKRYADCAQDGSFLKVFAIFVIWPGNFIEKFKMLVPASAAKFNLFVSTNFWWLFFEVYYYQLKLPKNLKNGPYKNKKIHLFSFWDLKRVNFLKITWVCHNRFKQSKTRWLGIGCIFDSGVSSRKSPYQPL